MSSRTSYRILENEEGESTITAGRKRFLEWIQPLNAYIRYVDGHIQALRKRAAPVIDRLGTKVLICATVLAIAGFTALGAFALSSSPDDGDVLQYVDPLIGTGRGGV